MKNIIVGVLTLIVVATAGWVASKGGPYNGGEHGKVIADMGNRTANAQSVQPVDKSDDQKEQDELNALREKAGNLGQEKMFIMSWCKWKWFPKW